VLDKLADKLAFWKARLMSRDGRVAYVRAVMAASVVYQLMALDGDPWFLQAMDKLPRAFLWAGKNEANGRKQLLGGLGRRVHTKMPWWARVAQPAPDACRVACPLDFVIVHIPLQRMVGISVHRPG
jgi:hypothetical protein